MCGRYTVRSIQPVAELFGIALPPEFQPRFNIAPTQDVPVVRAAEGGGRRAELLHWGLVPRWAEDPSVGNRMINARAETVATKPAYREALVRRRCIVPADAFYEWKATGGRTRRPYAIARRDGKPLAFAGLWDAWRDPNDVDSAPLRSC